MGCHPPVLGGAHTRVRGSPPLTWSCVSSRPRTEEPSIPALGQSRVPGGLRVVRRTGDAVVWWFLPGICCRVLSGLSASVPGEEVTSGERTGAHGYPKVFCLEKELSEHR